MPITITIPNGPPSFGPGGPVLAQSDLLGLANPPYRWTFFFRDLDGQLLVQQEATTEGIDELARIQLLWNDLDSPSPLAAQVHANPGDRIRLSVEVRDSTGLVDQTPAPVEHVWQPVAWSHLNSLLWANNIVTRVTGGTSSDKLDQILAAVYQTFPNA